MEINYLNTLNDIADRLAQVSAHCLNLRLEPQVPTSQRISLGVLEAQLDVLVIEIRTNMIKVVIEQLSPDILTITEKTKDLKAVLEEIKDLEETIDTVAKVVSFGVALTTQNYKLAGRIIGDIVKEKKRKKREKNSGTGE